MWIVDYFKGEGSVIKSAPFSFFVFLAIGLVAGFSCGQYLMSQELANAESLIRLKDGQIDGYQKSINERLEKVEKQLSAQQLSSIESVLKNYPSMVAIVKGQVPSVYEKQLVEAFEGSGWDVRPKEPQNQREGIILQTEDPKSASTISEALGKAGLKFEAVETMGAAGITEFYLGKPEL